MTTLMIKDLARNEELNGAAMAAVRGGYFAMAGAMRAFAKPEPTCQEVCHFGEGYCEQVCS